MEFNDSFAAAVRYVIKGIIRANTVVEVVSVDKTTNTCVVNENENEITNVRLLSTEDDFANKFVIYPKVGSLVTIAYLWWKGNRAVVIKCSETDEILVNGDAFGGMVKVEVLVDRLTKLEDRFNDFKAKFNAHTHILTLTSGTGTAASTLSQITMANLSETQKVDIENSKVKHG